MILLRRLIWLSLHAICCKTIHKRKSGFNPNWGCYFTADGKYYCYERWDDENKCIITQKLKIGKGLSLELPIMLDESDHDMNLQDRYESEQHDLLFDTKVVNYKIKRKKLQ